MRVLGIDTVGAEGGVALWEPDSEPVARALGDRRRHAEALLPEILALLEERDLSWSGVDRVAVNVGPGSFTGIRVGLAAALGLAEAGGPAARGVGCLDILGRACYDATSPQMGGYIVSVADVRRGEVVLRRYRVDTGGVFPEGVEQLVAVVDPGPVPPPGTVVAGDGASLLWPESKGIVRWEPTGIERALAAARLGEEATGAGPHEPLEPRYAREADARPRRRRG
jgi:tRNA threonylcarbamoyl adenosine modification protein YeaZ